MDLMTLAMAKALGSNRSVAEKTLGQRGFITNASSINIMNGTAPDYRISINAGYGQDYVPEAGSLLIVRAPSSGIAANATLKFAVGSQKYTQSWPIRVSSGPISDGYVKANEIVLLSFNGKSFYVASVVRDPDGNVPTKLSDLENDLSLSDFNNDLDLSGINVIDLSAMALSFMGLVSAVKSGISGNSGEKTVFFQANGNFATVVMAVQSSFASAGQLPVIYLGTNAYFPVLNTGVDDPNAWFTVSMNETEMSGTSLIGYTHEIVVAIAGVVIHTQKYEIDVQTLPSGD